MSATFCHICCHESDLFCVGSCDHPICFECGVRMRVICESSECPVCRADIKTMWVVVGENMSPYSKYETMRRAAVDNNLERQHRLKFENSEALNAVRDILAHVCTVCEKEPEFSTFAQLSQHMRRSHELYYCDLCVSNLKLFSWERKCYNREQLAKHRRIGDPDDRSHRGHPLCQFCDERYMDDEQLYRHLRKDHFFCHFCDADGVNSFYPSSEELKRHFKSKHFLCEEGQCRDEPLGISFRNDIDFKAHKAKVHHDKQERLVNLNFGTRRPVTGDRRNGFRENQQRERPNGGRDGDQRFTTSRDGPAGQKTARGRPGQTRGGGPNRRQEGRAAENGQSDDAEMFDSQSGAGANAKNVCNFDLKTEEFPSLGPTAGNVAQASTGNEFSMANRVGSSAGRSYGLPTRSGSYGENDFPSLPSNIGAKNKAKNGKKGRKNSRSVSPPKKEPQKTFVMIDDDESFPSASAQLKAMDTAGSAKDGREKSAQENRQRNQENQQRKQQTASGWGSKATGKSEKMKSSSAWTSRDDAFPALSSSNAGSSKKATVSDLLSKPWSQLILTDSGSGQRKEEARAQKEKKKNNATSPSSMATDALMESLPVNMPVKSKARRVAQMKQRPSESHDDDQAPEMDSGMTSLCPPPGFENTVPPPPGFESAPPSLEPYGTKTRLEPDGLKTSYSSNALEKDQENTYTKPRNFDGRNRALFNELCHSMKNDEGSIQAFKKSSSQYRRGELDAQTYCKRVMALLGDYEDRPVVFNELVCLLPDIGRQKALWESYIAEIGDPDDCSLQALKGCPECGQLLVKMDYYDHVNSAHEKKGFGGRNRYEEYPPLC